MLSIQTFNGLIKALFFIHLITFSVCNVYADDPYQLLIKTVNKDNQPMNGEILNWWFNNNPTEKYTQNCQTACSEWLISNQQPLDISVHILATKIKVNDPECWDWFEGQVQHHTDEKLITLALTYTSTVCK